MEPLGSATNRPDEEEAARSIHFMTLMALLLGLDLVRKCACLEVSRRDTGCRGRPRQRGGTW